MSVGRRVLVLGVGNVLLGDEGVGVHAAQRLAEETWPGHVTVLDGGTGGFHLLSPVMDHEAVVLVDATMDGAPAGTVRHLVPRFLSDVPRTLSAHDIGLRDLLESACLLGASPRVDLVTVSVEKLPGPEAPLSTELSRDVAAALEAVLPLVRGLALQNEGGPPAR